MDRAPAAAAELASLRQRERLLRPMIQIVGKGFRASSGVRFAAMPLPSLRPAGHDRCWKNGGDAT
jgi:hypothetical protein